MDDTVDKFISLQIFFNLPPSHNRFELYTDTFDEFSFTELKDELEEILGISNISPEQLQDKIIGPRKNSAYIKQKTKKDWLMVRLF